MVRMRGLEPPPSCLDQNLNLARLPIPPHPHSKTQKCYKNPIGGAKLLQYNGDMVEPESNKTTYAEYHPAQNGHFSLVPDTAETVSFAESGAEVVQNPCTTILLTRGYHAIISLCDLDLVSQYKWRAKVEPDGHVYARAHVPRKNGKRGPDILMHRLIAGALPGDKVDHRDGDGLNNRRSNLRRCTNRQNIRNQKPHSDKRTSKFKGVAFLCDRNKYRAQIMHNGVKINLGSFASELDAARAYDNAARKLHGEFARVNFPLEVAA